MDIAGLKCHDLTYDAPLQCRGCARALISRLNRLHPARTCHKDPLNSAPKHLTICKPKGLHLSGFGGQFACSWAGTDPKIVGGRGPNLNSFTYLSVPIDHSKGTKLSNEGVGRV